MRGLFLLIGAVALAGLCGCKGDRCEELAAQAQIDVKLDGTIEGDVDSSEVVLIINGDKEVSHSFGKAAPSFVFKFEQQDRAPRTLTIKVMVYDKGGSTLGSGQMSTTFSSDGCNFFSVKVGPEVVSDAGHDGEVTDAGSPDGPAIDVAGQDGESDAPTPDLPPPDMAADLPPPDMMADLLPADSTVDLPAPDLVEDLPTPDTTFDLGADTAVDAGVGADSVLDAGQDSAIVGPVVNMMDPYGIAISTAMDDQGDPRVAYDGTNFFVVWEDYRNGAEADIYGARISPDGTLLDPDGIAISTAPGDQAAPAVAFNGTDYLVVWEDLRDGISLDIYGTRVGTDGSVKDGAGFPIFVAAEDQSNPDLAHDGTNYLVVWQDVDGENIVGARVDGMGTVLDTAGISICTAGNGQYSAAVAFDGANYLVVWWDYRKTWDDADIYGARVSPGGTVLDPAGIPIGTAAGDQRRPAVAFDGTRYLVVWGDKRDGIGFKIYGARVNPDGTVLDPAGIPICTDSGMQYSPAVAFDGINFLVAFFESSSGENIFGVRVSPDGTVLDASKIDISTAGGSQDHPAMAFDGSRLLVVWDDFRNGATSDIYGARVAEPARGTWLTIPPAGTTLPVTFSMGSPTSEPCRDTNETLHQVTLTHAFEISISEVTQGEFEALMGYNPSHFGPNGAGAECGSACPVEDVSWHEAVAYCNALSARAGLDGCYSCSGGGKTVTCQEASSYSGSQVYDCPGYRLPTEAEWEFAYRAGSGTAFYPSAGNDGSISVCSGASDANADKIGWNNFNSGGTTHPVGLMPSNAWGIYDMAGNVYEWCHDWYQSDLGSSAVTDPWGAASGTDRILRSGSWNSNPFSLRAANRYSYSAGSDHYNRGIRCCRSRM